MPNPIEQLRGLLGSPAVRGVGGAIALGANPAVGLLAAPALRDRRTRKELENEMLREEIRNRRRTNDAHERLAGLLSQDVTATVSNPIALEDVEGGPATVVNPGRRARVPYAATDDGQRAIQGALTDIAPAAAVNAMLNPREGRADPAVIRTLEAIGINPRSPEGREIALKSLIQNNANDELMAGIMLRIRELDLARAQDELNEGRRTRAEERKSLEAGINGTLKDLEALLGYNNDLEGSFLQPGLPGAGARRTAASITSEIGGMFGADTSGIEGDIDTVDKFSKMAANVGIDTLAGLNNFGTLTDEKLRTYNASIANIGVNPGANRLIIADLIEEMLVQAEVLGFDNINTRHWRSIAAQARNKSSKSQREGDVATRVRETREGAVDYSQQSTEEIIEAARRALAEDQ